MEETPPTTEKNETAAQVPGFVLNIFKKIWSSATGT
jgi:hypothetical protein